MHLVIPFAAPAGPQCQAALDRLELPHLKSLLRALTPHGELQGQANDLSPLPERVLSQNAFADGLVPWAALRARALPNVAPGAASGLITPCHLTVHADHIAMQDPAALRLEADESLALLQAMAPYFLEDGLSLHFLQANTWLVQGEALRSLATASIERVRGHKVDPWMPRTEAARLVRRLQNEMQMLLYTHPVNDARVARGAPMVNSFLAQRHRRSARKRPAISASHRARRPASTRAAGRRCRLDARLAGAGQRPLGRNGASTGQAQPFH
jgi:hypothetical protein